MTSTHDKPESDDQNPAADPPARVTRHIQPVGPRVLVRIIQGPDRSESGLFLPQGVKESNASALLGEVLEVARTLPKADLLDPDAPASDHDDDGDRADLGKNVSGIPLGANVLFEKEKGIAVPWDETLRVLEVRHVLAIVDIISEDEIQ